MSKLMGCVMQKDPYRPESLSCAHPSYFWYDTDFSELDSADIIDYSLKVGMTTT